MLAIGYARLSKSNDLGHGIAVQNAAIRAYCEQHSHELLRIETDDGISGASKKRPAYERALQSCRAGEAEAIIASKLDRLGRSLLSFAELIEDAQKHSYSVIAIDQAFDLNTPAGRAMAGILNVFSVWERETISARTKAALSIAKANGQLLGNPTFVAASDELRDRILSLRSEGLSYAKVAKRLSDEQVKTLQGGTWTGTTVRRIAIRS